jgi:dTDP-4-dehydrorhamnose 3,5-epimerase
MQFKEGDIDGLIVRDLKFFKDKRGWLSELFRNDELSEDIRPEMAYFSMTLPGVLRGPHEHVEQTDYFIFWSSTFRIVLWDQREGSPTRMNRKVITVGEDSPMCLVVPPGVVHAYKNVGRDEGIVLNFPNRLFAGRGKKETVDEIRYEDDPDTIYRMEE